MSAPIDDGNWMYEWIDEYEVHSRERLHKCLESGLAIERLHKLAVRAFTFDLDVKAPDFTVPASSVVAGGSIDLSGVTGCGSLLCLKAQVDRALVRTWHYFDKVVVSGPQPLTISTLIESSSPRSHKDLIRRLETSVSLLNYIRDSGASSRISFLPNSGRYCKHCLQEAAGEIGLDGALDGDLENAIVSQMVKDGRFTVKGKNRHWKTHVDHPFLEEPLIIPSANKRKPSKHQVARELFDDLCVSSVVDYAKSRNLKLPLVTTATSSWSERIEAWDDGGVQQKPNSVALRIDLPFISGLPLADLIKVTDEYRPHFVRFQSSLRKAIEEQVARHGDLPDEMLANAVLRDYIEPELEDINRRLKVTRRTLGKKLSAGFAVGGVVASVGLLAAIPVIIGAGVAAAGSISPVQKYFDDRQAIEMSDLYFLWNMRNAAHSKVSN